MLLRMLKERRENDEGFTLIELMVVVLIIAILLAIAIPTFLGARTKAQNRGAQANLRNALTAEKTVYTDNSNYDANTANMLAVEPALKWAQTDQPSLGQIGVRTFTQNGNNDAVVITAMDPSGAKCWYISDEGAALPSPVVAGNGTPGTFFAFTAHAGGTQNNCAALAPPLAANPVPGAIATPPVSGTWYTSW